MNAKDALPAAQRRAADVKGLAAEVERIRGALSGLTLSYARVSLPATRGFPSSYARVSFQ